MSKVPTKKIPSKKPTGNFNSNLSKANGILLLVQLGITAVNGIASLVNHFTNGNQGIRKKIKKLDKMLKKGEINQEQYQKAKDSLLSEINSSEI